MVMPAGMAVARHRPISDIRLDFAQRLIAEAPLLQYPGAEILNHDVGDGDQPLHDLQAFGASHVQTEALLVDVRVVEVSRGVQIDLEILRRGGARQPAALILRPLDFYDLGPERPQPACGPWPGPHPAEVHHADVFKGSWSRHGVVLLLGPSPGTEGRLRLHAALIPPRRLRLGLAQCGVDKAEYQQRSE